MKKVKKMTSLIMALVMVACVALTTGCAGEKEQSKGKGTLKISAVELGYGVDWLTALVEAFEEETGYEVTVVNPVGSLGVNALATELESKASDSDLIFNKFQFFAKYVHEGKTVGQDGKSYDCLLEDITDVWESVVDEGSTQTIASKMDSEYESYYNMDGKYYGIPWAGGVFGIVRNVDVWNDLGLKDSDVPLTTDSMFALCDKVKDKVSPFIFSTKQNYYESFMPIFMAQYEGVDNYKKFLNGVDPDGAISEYVYTYDGALESMKILEKLLNQDNNYQSSMSSLDFNLMQGQFLSGAALFCVNGSWLEREMVQNYASANIDYIRTPVVSSIINKLDTVKDDATLIEVIKYIDALDSGENPEKPQGVSDSDIAVVTEARHYSYVAGGIDHQVVIPAYSDNIKEAKEFLKFMYSDKGLNIYYKTLNGNMLPATPVSGYDTEGVEISDFIKSSNEATAMGFALRRESTAKYFSLGGIVTTFNNGGSAVEYLYNGSKNASQVIDMNTEAIKGKWKTIKQYLEL